jgi:hypothetical protein
MSEQKPKIYKQGYLLKQGDNNRVWKRRFFVLEEGRLVYYASENSSEDLGHLLLNSLASVSETSGPKGYPFVVKYLGPKHQKQYTLAAQSPAERAEWIRAIRMSILGPNKAVDTVDLNLDILANFDPSFLESEVLTLTQQNRGAEISSVPSTLGQPSSSNNCQSVSQLKKWGRKRGMSEGQCTRNSSISSTLRSSVHPQYNQQQQQDKRQTMPQQFQANETLVKPATMTSLSVSAQISSPSSHEHHKRNASLNIDFLTVPHFKYGPKNTSSSDNNSSISEVSELMNANSNVSDGDSDSPSSSLSLDNISSAYSGDGSKSIVVAGQRDTQSSTLHTLSPSKKPSTSPKKHTVSFASASSLHHKRNISLTTDFHSSPSMNGRVVETPSSIPLSLRHGLVPVKPLVIEPSKELPLMTDTEMKQFIDIVKNTKFSDDRKRLIQNLKARVTCKTLAEIYASFDFTDERILLLNELLPHLVDPEHFESDLLDFIFFESEREKAIQLFQKATEEKERNQQMKQQMTTQPKSGSFELSQHPSLRKMSGSSDSLIALSRARVQNVESGDSIHVHKRTVSNMSVSSISGDDRSSTDDWDSVVDFSNLKPLDPFQLERLLRSLNATPFVHKRKEIISSVRQTYCLTCSQLGEILSALKFADERVRAVYLLGNSLLDRENIHLILDKVRFHTERYKVRLLLLSNDTS